ncbi:hypothetical protein [Rhodovarius crocodyli]|nr:hypothetical protein [Rhodovarius crocodyli]
MLAVLDAGSYYHHHAIHGAPYRHLFDRVIYTPDLDRAALEGVSVLLVADRNNPVLLRRHADLILGHWRRGGTLVVLGENEAESWVPGVRWSPRPTNFWWWLEPGAKPEHQYPRPEHEFFRHVPPEDTVWHYHGVLQPPPGAEALITVPPDPEGRDQGGALLYEDRASEAGRLLIATLDPFYHHGSRFMPSTTRFLDGFLPWMNRLARQEAVAEG